MAELILSAFLPVLLDKLASAALRSFARNNGIDADINKWQRSLNQIQGLLADASRKEINNDQSVKRWLNELQQLAYDIDDALDDLAYQAMDREFKRDSEAITTKVRKILPSCCSSFSRDTSMHEKFNYISTKLQDLVNEKTGLGLRVEEETRPRNNNYNANNNRRFQSSVNDSFSIVGRKKEKQELVDQLLGKEPSDQNFSIVPIVGMGGVGKTTLARILYDEQRVKDHFELNAWVCISEEFDIFGRSKAIFEDMAKGSREFSDINVLQEALRDHVKGKRFLLVLDDIWFESYTDWVTLVRPFYACASGSKIIITTRKDELLKKLVHGPLNKQLLGLSSEDALSLLAQHALGVDNFDSHLSLKPLAEGIVKKCGGLPLALTALGRLLRTKREEVEHWKKILDSEIWRLKDGGEILPALEVSYHELSAPLKWLFAYCSLFPKDFLFDKEELVLLWMAEGFLHPPTPNDSIEESLGYDYFDELLSRSFFQHAPDNESMFVMHDLMNDLATSVAGEFFVRLGNETKKNPRKEMLEKYRHMSYVCDEYVVQKFQSAKSVRTFLATSVGVERQQQHFYIPNKILVDLLYELPLLRVLCLNNFRISEVPESIGTLRHLRYLNISESIVKHLPESVCNLYNLETLILSGCWRLAKLPSNLLKLKKLRHLDIRGTSLLVHLPCGIGELDNLRTLSKIIIGDESGFEIAKFKEFKSLCGKISIEGLDKVENAIHAREANFSGKSFSKLELVWSNELHGARNEILEKEVLNELKPVNDKLIQLEIRSYGGLEFPNWVGNPSFLHLKHVSLRGCTRCTTLPPLGQLPSLKELFIIRLTGVKVVGLELLGSSRAFPSLEVLHFEYMDGWGKWLTNTGIVFPRLKHLVIRDCPNLVEVILEPLPLLNVLKIHKCVSGVLRTLVQVAPAVTKLDIRGILGLNDVVWRGVIEYLGAVESLSILVCSEIRYLWESEAVVSKFFVKLRELEVVRCDNLVSLGEKDEKDDCRSNLLTSLRMLDVSECKIIKRCSCPHSIEKLFVSSCSSITDISLPIGGQNFKTLGIFDCDQIPYIEWGGQKMINNIEMLESLFIYEWPNLKSIIELKYLVHLTSLSIVNCKSLESFPYTELSNLILLKFLDIRNCPSMDVCFPGGVWPPKLQNLDIGKLKKPMSEWGPQNFPTSLVQLCLYGGKDGASSCSQLTHLLPSSVTYLHIIEFDKLESYSMGLQHLECLSFSRCPNLQKLSHPHPEHLTSLKHMWITDCPNMMDLPEVLLRSLLRLIIQACPKLKERCSKRGCYGTLVSDIPFFRLYPED